MSRKQDHLFSFFFFPTDEPEGQIHANIYTCEWKLRSSGCESKETQDPLPVFEDPQTLKPQSFRGLFSRQT